MLLRAATCRDLSAAAALRPQAARTRNAPRLRRRRRVSQCHRARSTATCRPRSTWTPESVEQLKTASSRLEYSRPQFQSGRAPKPGCSTSRDSRGPRLCNDDPPRPRRSSPSLIRAHCRSGRSRQEMRVNRRRPLSSCSSRAALWDQYAPDHHRRFQGRRSYCSTLTESRSCLRRRARQSLKRSSAGLSAAGRSSAGGLLNDLAGLDVSRCPNGKLTVRERAAIPQLANSASASCPTSRPRASGSRAPFRRSPTSRLVSETPTIVQLDRSPSPATA